MISLIAGKILAIVYALVMNVVLLSYLKLLPKCTDETASDGA